MMTSHLESWSTYSLLQSHLLRFQLHVAIGLASMDARVICHGMFLMHIHAAFLFFDFLRLWIFMQTSCFLNFSNLQRRVLYFFRSFTKKSKSQVSMPSKVVRRTTSYCRVCVPTSARVSASSTIRDVSMWRSRVRSTAWSSSATRRWVHQEVIC